MNRRAAVYLRFSSDKQSMTSLDDQLRVCREYIAAQGDVLLNDFIFQDAAVSGVSEAGRDGFQRLKAAICRRPAPVEALVVADLSRLSRDLHDMSGLMKELAYFGVELVGVADGMTTSAPASKMGIVLKSLMNEMFIADLAKKTREGLVGQALRGFSTGGRIFGYGTQKTVVPGLDNKTNAKVFIIEEQAAVIREIYALAADGLSIERIVKRLNERGALCPNPGRRERRPSGWTYSSLRSVLRNPKYTGTWIFRQSHFVKNPQTGKRQRRMLEEHHWLVSPHPELAIVSKELFDRVQGTLDDRSAKYRRAQNGQLSGSKPGATRATYLLSGVARCGVCGVAMTIYGGKRSGDGTKVYRCYRCPAAHRSGPTLCKNKLSISKDKLEGAVLGKVSETLFSTDCVALFEQEFRLVYEETLRTEGRQRRVAELEREVDGQRARLDRLIDALAAGESQAVRSKVAQAERHLTELQGQLERQLAQPTLAAPEVVSETLRAALAEFKRLLESNPDASKELLRALLDGELRLMPKEVRTDAGKGKTRSTWFYEVSGSAFLQNLLIPLRGGDQDGLPVVAGA